VIESVLTWLTTTVSGRAEIALLAAAGWGVVSILFSPCHLSSIPLVVGYIGSQGEPGTGRSFMMSLLFSLGMLITIGAIGALTASAGRMMGDVGAWGNVLVAGVFFVVGLHLMEVITLPWSGIVPRASFARGWKGALLLGLLFGFGLGPCTFAYMAPVLGVVLDVATTNLVKALSLVAAFGIGHCAVIVVAGTAAATVQRYLHWTERSKGALYIKRTAGALVMLGGVYFIYTAY
jgi:cytochrome c-type biogenesis protein